jgi:WD40 repeat protein
LAHARFTADGTALLLGCEDGLKQWHFAGSSMLNFSGEPEAAGTDGFPLSWRLDVPADRRWALAIERWTTRESSRVIIRDGSGDVRVLASPIRAALVNASLSPDHRWLALGHHKAATMVVDLQTREVVKQWPAVQTAFVSFSPDGRWLVTGTGQQYEFWDTDSWQPGRRIESGAASPIAIPMAFSPDGRVVALLKGFRRLQLHDWRSGEVLAELANPRGDSINSFTFSPDGNLLAVTAQSMIQLWDLREIRHQLAKLNLDWNQPPCPPSTVSLGDVAFRFTEDATN